MIRLAMNVVSWALMAGGVLVSLAFLASAAEGGFRSFRLEELAIATVVGGVLVAAGAILQMLVSIDERLERQGGG